MNGTKSGLFSQQLVKPAVSVVLLVLLALGSSTKESWAVRDEADFYNAQFPSAPNCNACEYWVKKLETAGPEASSCVSPSPCALPTFPAVQDYGATTNPPTPVPGAHSTNYPYYFYNGDLQITGNITFQGPAGTGFLTIYVAGYLCVTGGGTITITNNVRFVASGTTNPGTLCGANPTIYFANGSNVVSTGGTGVGVFMGTNISTGSGATPPAANRIYINYPGGVAGSAQNILMIATGNYTEGTGGTGTIRVSGGIFANGTITTQASAVRNTGELYSAWCPNPPSNITHTGGYKFTQASAATNAIQKIDFCADPGSP